MQYINYNDDGIYDYGNNWQGDGENSEELGYVENFDQELGYEEDVSQGIEEGEELDDGEGYRDWEEEVRREGWSHGELEYQEIQEHQSETEIKEETGYGAPQGWSTPPMKHPYYTLDSPFIDPTYTVSPQGSFLSPLLPPSEYLLEGFQSGSGPTQPFMCPPCTHSPPTHYLNPPDQPLVIPTQEQLAPQPRQPISAGLPYGNQWQTQHVQPR